MNRDQKAAAIDEIADADPGVRGGLRRRLPRHLRAAGRRAARASCATPTPRFRIVKNTLTERAADKAERRGAEGAARGPDRADVRARRRRRGGQGARATTRAATELLAVQGRAAWTARRSTPTQITVDRPAARRARCSTASSSGVVASPITGLARGLNALDRRPRRSRSASVPEKKESGEIPAGEAPAAGRGAGRRGRGARRRGRGASRRAGGRGAAEDATERPRDEPAEGARRPTDDSETPGGLTHGHQHPGVDRGAQGHLRARARRAHQGARGGVRRVGDGRRGRGPGRRRRRRRRRRAEEEPTHLRRRPHRPPATRRSRSSRSSARRPAWA